MLFAVLPGPVACARLLWGEAASPSGFMAIAALTIPEIQVYLAVVSEMQGQQCGCVFPAPERQHGHGWSWAPSRPPQHWCEEAPVISDGGTWARNRSPFHSQVSGVLH